MATMGRPFKYDAEQIKQLYNDYKEYISTQYFERPELIKSGERAGEVIYIKVYKPQTIESFCLYIDMDLKTYYNYINGNSDNIDENLIQNLMYVHTSIKDSQISGATVNVYNPMIVSRVNGLTETQQLEVTGNKLQAININVNGSDIDITSD